VKPAPFAYHAPETVAGVLALLAEHGDEAKPLAGGQSLVPMLALRLARFAHLVDVNRVEVLRGVTTDDGVVRVGATTRQRAVERLTEVPLLARATRLVGHFQIRNRGTVGGSLAHADPASEYPAVALALDAQLELDSVRGTRRVPAADFFVGTWETAAGPDELLVGAEFPVWAGRCGYAVEEVARRHGDFALAGAVCAVQVGEGGGVERAAVTLFGVASTPVRAAGAEDALRAGAAAVDVAHEAVRGLDPPDDVHASGATRSRIARAVVVRAVDKALGEARA
jgi:carbon-monoxide dehydrogenase medium subunit